MEPVKTPKQHQREKEADHEQEHTHVRMKRHQNPRCLKCEAWRSSLRSKEKERLPCCQAIGRKVRIIHHREGQCPSIRLVQDNLNTHTPAALYETFPPTEARRILQRLEFHYTPKHGSWLNMAEIEIAILERNALSRRLPDEAALRREVSAVETERNAQRRGIRWQFTSRDARRKLERLYPVKEPEAV